MFNRFYFAKFKIKLRLKEPISRPPYLGSTIRGGFGRTLKKVVCVARDKECERCILKKNCVYSYLFLSPKLSQAKENDETYPHPYLIEPLTDTPLELKPGDVFSFNLLLIGKGIDYLPYFIFAFDKLGRIGLGSKRSKYELIEVEDVLQTPSQVIYFANRFVANFKKMNFQELIEESQNFSLNKVLLEFLTPTRIKYNRRYLTSINFPIFMTNILRRLTMLAKEHCNFKPEIDRETLLSEAKKIVVLESKLNWQPWKRYSRRQERRIDLSGFVGKITFQGEMGEFLPYIKLGEYIHIGKNTSFGLGQYRILSLTDNIGDGL